MAPISYGVLLIPGFDLLDVFGPLEYINCMYISILDPDDH